MNMILITYNVTNLTTMKVFFVFIRLIKTDMRIFEYLITYKYSLLNNNNLFDDDVDQTMA